MILAAANGHNETVALLLQSNVDINAKRNDGFTALIAALLSIGFTANQIRQGEDPGRAISFGTGTFLGYRLTTGLGARLMSMPNPLAKLLGFGIAVGGPFLGGEIGNTPTRSDSP